MNRREQAVQMLSLELCQVFSETKLNAYVAAKLSPEQLKSLEDSARLVNADSKLMKALALAQVDYSSALAIYQTKSKNINAEEKN